MNLSLNKEFLKEMKERKQSKEENKEISPNRGKEKSFS